MNVSMQTPKTIQENKEGNTNNMEPRHKKRCRNGEINIQDLQSRLWSPQQTLEWSRDFTKKGEDWGVPVMKEHGNINQGSLSVG